MTSLLSFVVLSLARVSTIAQTDKNCSYGETPVLCVLPVIGTHARNTSFAQGRGIEIGDVVYTSNVNVTCINRNMWIEMPGKSFGQEDRICRVDSRRFALQQGLSARSLAHFSCKLHNQSYQNLTEVNYVHHICKIPATGRLRVLNIDVRSILATGVEAIESTCQCEVSVILKWIEGILQHSSVSCTESQHSFLASVQLQDVDECINGSHNCDVNAYCINTPGSFRCVCRTCYSGDGVFCTRTICSKLPQVLEGNVSAAATFCGETASFTCHTGYRLLGPSVRQCGINGQWTEQQPTCEDINECSEGTHNCSPPGGLCSNTAGGFSCLCNSCPENGTNCSVIACSQPQAPCHGYVSVDETTCGSVATFSCLSGYFISGASYITCQTTGLWSGNATCNDIDECANGVHSCTGMGIVCKNTPGSFICSCEICHQINGNFSIRWTFHDLGFVVGGQQGSLRNYTNPNAVTASPWTVSDNGLDLQFEFESSLDCDAGGNRFVQTGDASAAIELILPTNLTMEWTGEGETQSNRYDRMEIWLDGNLIVQALSSGDRSGGRCCISPVRSSPQQPVTVLLLPGKHEVNITLNSIDTRYHHGAFYKISFRAVI